MKDVKNTGFPHDPGDWADCADEYVLLIRALDQIDPSVFEVVRAKRPDRAVAEVEYSHEVIFVDEYLSNTAGLAALDEILRGFGYDGLDDFVMQNATTNEFIYKDGVLDRENSPAYIVDLFLLVSLIAEIRGSDPNNPSNILMRMEDAIAMVKAVTGVNFQYIG